MSHTTCPADDSLAVLWALTFARDNQGRDSLTAAEVAAIVTSVGRRSLTRQSALSRLTRFSTGPEVHRTRKRNAPDLFTIMVAGEALLDVGATVTLVDPTKALQEVRNLETVLSSVRGKTSICDPYLDSRTLDFLGFINAASSIRFLTERVTDRDKVSRELAVLMKQTGITVEVRLARKGVLHDRYIVHEGGMLILGTSFNSFGLRQSFMLKAGHDVAQATRDFFDTHWGPATLL